MNVNKTPKKLKSVTVRDIRCLIVVCLTFILGNKIDHPTDQNCTGNQAGNQQEGIQIVDLSGDVRALRGHERVPMGNIHPIHEHTLLYKLTWRLTADSASATT